MRPNPRQSARENKTALSMLILLRRPPVSPGFAAVMGRTIGAKRVRSLEIRSEPPARPRWCDQIPTPAKNQLYPYSEHSCAHRHSHDFGKLFGD
jgi:hypothetical protein